MSAYSIIKILSLILYIASGFLVLVKNPRQKQNQIFSLSVFSLAFTEFGFLLLLMGFNAVICTRIALVGQCLAHVNIILLSLVYGRENYQDSLKRGKPYLIAAYFISLIFIVLLITGVVKIQLPIEFNNHVLIFDKVGSIFIAFLLICTLITLVNLENTYHQASHSQNFIKFPALVLISVLSLHILIYSLILGSSRIRIDILVIASLSFLVSCLCMAYPVIKADSSEPRIYVGRAVISKSYTLLLAGLYLLIVGMLGKIIQIIGKNLNFFFAFLVAFVVLFILIALILSKSIKQRFQSFFEHNFYRHKYDYRQEWDNFSRRVFSSLSMEDLLNEVVNVVSDTIKPDSVSIMLLDQRNDEYVVVASEIKDVLSIPVQNDFLEWLWRYGKPIRIDNGQCMAYGTFSHPPGIPEQLLKLLDNSSSGMFAPIIAEHTLMAIMVLGNRENPPYSQEDLDLMETMANQIRIAIINARASQELAISRELESFHKLSAMLLHDLKSSASMLSLVVQNSADNFDNPEFQKDALSTMSSVVNRIQKLILRLSAAPREVDPKSNLQLTDIVSIVRGAIDRSGVRRLDRITIMEDLKPVPQLMADPENIERVILNLILNSIEAIEDKGTITIITCQTSNGYAQISVSDTGCGMTQDFIKDKLFQPFQTTKQKGLGIGLYQCKAIIDAMGGFIEVQSIQEAGSTFIVKIPMKLADKANRGKVES
jgi:putative PEP-CTERM system histidine kinase